jgi:hypothetical protein
VVVVNLFDDDWDLDEEHGDFGGRDAWIGARLGSELIGGVGGSGRATKQRT